MSHWCMKPSWMRRVHALWAKPEIFPVAEPANFQFSTLLSWMGIKWFNRATLLDCPKCYGTKQIREKIISQGFLWKHLLDRIASISVHKSTNRAVYVHITDWTFFAHPVCHFCTSTWPNQTDHLIICTSWFSLCTDCYIVFILHICWSHLLAQIFILHKLF